MDNKTKSIRITGKTDNLAIINIDTGEIIDHVMFFGKKPYYKDKGYAKVFIAFLSDLVTDDEIIGKAARLLFYFIEKMDFQSLKVTVSPKKIQKDLGIKKPTFYRWLKVLINKKLVERDPDDYATFYLRPYVAIKGNMQDVINRNTKEHLKKITA